MQILKKALLIVMALVLAAGAAAYYVLHDVPEVSGFSTLFDRSTPGPHAEIRVTFLGVATLLIEDGETAILTDGFFTRPSVTDVLLRKIEPDRQRIANALSRAGITRLAAILVNHSHYDHVMDAPEVARLTGGLLVGSQSTANVGRGWGLPETQIRVVNAGDALSFGRFRVRVLEGRHAPSQYALGAITEPLRPPVRAHAYREGGSLAFFIEYAGKSILINASAGFFPEMFRRLRADVMFLGVGALGSQSEQTIDAYWDETIGVLGVRRVFLIHWDNFMLPLDRPLEPLPRIADSLDVTLRKMNERGQAQGVEVKLLDLFAKIDPFQNL